MASRAWPLVAAVLTIARADHPVRIDTSHPYYIVSSPTSRSPTEYLYWGHWRSHCRRGSDDYAVSRCVPSEPLEESIPPAYALWWFVPVNETEPFTDSGTASWYYIVGSLNSSQPGMTLSFDGWGNVYPRPYWLGDESYLNELAEARFRLVESHDNSDFDLYYIICGERSGKANEMVFLNRNMGDWLATWTVDLTDKKATWRLVPAECGDVSCALPDFEAVYNSYGRWQWWYTLLICIGSMIFLRCMAQCFFGGRRRAREYSARRSMGSEMPVVVSATPVEAGSAAVTVVQASRV